MRRGSALLIVLGMMSFMVISAVAFSMFMRQSRLPSSFLRQKVAASQLAKAALAEAMRRIDAGIGDNPYPGVGSSGNRSKTFRYRDGSETTTTYGNYWRNRVFMESQVAQTQGESGSSAATAAQYDTVSTLTLEALAYLPPALVNTVRYWSKVTTTAAWASLGYDAGRYCFTAVNVSDYFDITRMKAGAMRDSTPEGRISLGFLFENEGQAGAGDPAAFDAFMAQSTNDVYRTRFVSLADFNLALATGVYGDPGFKSPFCEYIRNPPKDGSFYGSREEDAKAMKFVTDSWYPGDLTNANAVVLTDRNDGQPFSGKENATFDDLQLINGSRCYDILSRRLDVCTFAALYDYLDGNESRGGHVPISLAMPTLERTPMLTGLVAEPSGVALKLEHRESALESTDKVQRKLHTWSVQSFGDGAKVVVSACGAYPFKRKYNQESTSFTFQVLVRGFFAEDGFFAGNKESWTRLESEKQNLLKGIGKEWQSDTALKAQDKAWFTLVGEKQVTVTDGPLTPEQTTFDVFGIELNLDGAINSLAGAPVYGIEERVTKDEYGNPMKTEYLFNDAEMDEGKRLFYYPANGTTPSRAFGETGPKLRLHYFVLARILDGDGNTVDLVPARVCDDREYLGVDNEGGNASDMKKICGELTPALPMHSDLLTELEKNRFVDAVKQSADVVQPMNVDQGKLAIYCDDPRFNYAPEDWYQSENGDVQGSVWLAAAQSRCNGGDHRAHDIFMAVSDAGYDRLQSLGELQFLPYLLPFGDGNGGMPNSGFYNAAKYNGQPFSQRTSPGACANHDYAWKSHWAYGSDRDRDDQDPYNWGILDALGGPKVNPYADESMLMAALANTPYDWSVAAGGAAETLAEGKQYCFGPGSTEAKVEWDDLLDIAAEIKSRVGLNTNWERIWRDEIDWESDKLFGLDNLDRTKLSDVDRKYLYSYWKGCFGNEQQLFLVFVRAEPSVMGGSSAGHTPAQLGARAVALVWREPVSSVDDVQTLDGVSTTPHRMRVLFYHEFQ